MASGLAEQERPARASAAMACVLQPWNAARGLTRLVPSARSRRSGIAVLASSRSVTFFSTTSRAAGCTRGVPCRATAMHACRDGSKNG